MQLPLFSGGLAAAGQGSWIRPASVVQQPCGRNISVEKVSARIFQFPAHGDRLLYIRRCTASEWLIWAFGKVVDQPQLRQQRGDGMDWTGALHEEFFLLAHD